MGADIVAIAEDFLGYGRWDAPFWFIGPEAGMKTNGDDTIESRCLSWHALGSDPLVDCFKHHDGFGFMAWHEEGAPTQPTWRQLIRLLLTYKAGNARHVDTEMIREYQRSRWGRTDGETCVMELSGLPAPSLRVKRDRETFLARRVERIKRELAGVQRRSFGALPVLVVMYGAKNLAEWRQIAGGEFDRHRFRWVGRTLAVAAASPTAHAIGNAYWEQLGVAMANAYSAQQIGIARQYS